MKLGNKISLPHILILLATTAVALLVLFKTVVSAQDFVHTFKSANIYLIFLAIVVGLSGPFLSALRWKSVLALSDHHVPFPKAFKVIMGAWPLSILPGRLGDFARSYPVRKTVPVAASISSTLFEKVVDVSVLILIASIGFLLLKKFIIGFLLLLGALLFLPTIFLSKHFLRYLPLFISSKLELLFQSFKHASVIFKKDFFIALSMSFCNWSASILETWLLYRSFGSLISLSAISAYLPLAIFIGLLPISIAGIGTRDSALISFFKGGASPAQSLAVGLGYTFIGYGLFSIIGIPYLIKEFGVHEE